MKVFLMIVVIVLIVDIALAVVYKLVERSKNKMIDDFVKELHKDHKKKEESE